MGTGFMSHPPCGGRLRSLFNTVCRANCWPETVNGATAGIGESEKPDQVIVDRRRGRLHEKDLLAAYGVEVARQPRRRDIDPRHSRRPECPTRTRSVGPTLGRPYR